MKSRERKRKPKKKNPRNQVQRTRKNSLIHPCFCHPASPFWFLIVRILQSTTYSHVIITFYGTAERYSSQSASRHFGYDEQAKASKGNFFHDLSLMECWFGLNQPKRVWIGRISKAFRIKLLWFLGFKFKIKLGKMLRGVVGRGFLLQWCCTFWMTAFPSFGVWAFIVYLLLGWWRLQWFVCVTLFVLLAIMRSLAFNAHSGFTFQTEVGKLMMIFYSLFPSQYIRLVQVIFSKYPFKFLFSCSLLCSFFCLPFFLSVVLFSMSSEKSFKEALVSPHHVAACGTPPCGDVCVPCVSVPPGGTVQLGGGVIL